MGRSSIFFLRSDEGGFAGGIPDTENRGRILAEAYARGSPLGADRRRVREVVRSPLHRYSLGPLRVNVSGFVTLCLFLFFLFILVNSGLEEVGSCY